ncbi:MAG: sigma-70 family RNA polymerase sigma factor [Candidatus Omnitrophica bacterium]|nr:sigma-70 family RNA polymerase sigma factor [Candidatus Omnitrophota bacterium]MBU4590629.1 sigma-70 family RNA polymerase sigma factor [Candidatus Omnitrophota bacterium]
MFDDTRKLVERCIRRDERAWEEFIERFSGLLFYSARERLLRNGIAFSQQDIEDIVQGIFLEIWEKGRLEEVRDRGKITAWLSIVGQTRALNFVWKRKERLLRQDELYRISNIKVYSEEQISEQTMEKLERLIKRLNARERVILKLNLIYGKTHREIAGFMSIPINTVSTIIARRKKELKGKLKEI